MLEIDKRKIFRPQRGLVYVDNNTGPVIVVGAKLNEGFQKTGKYYLADAFYLKDGLLEGESLLFTDQVEIKLK
jgi:hypothetical protein